MPDWGETGVPESPHVRLAKAYAAEGRIVEGEMLLEERVQAEEATYGHDHERTLTALCDLADFYKSQGQDVDAEWADNHLLSRVEDALGFDHPVARRTMDVNGHVDYHISRGQGFLAELTLKSLWDRTLKHRGLEHPDTQAVAKSLANFYIKEGQLDEAESYLALIKDVVPSDQSKKEPIYQAPPDMYPSPNSPLSARRSPYFETRNSLPMNLPPNPVKAAGNGKGRRRVTKTSGKKSKKGKSTPASPEPTPVSAKSSSPPKLLSSSATSPVNDASPTNVGPSSNWDFGSIRGQLSPKDIIVASSSSPFRSLYQELVYEGNSSTSSESASSGNDGVLDWTRYVVKGKHVGGGGQGMVYRVKWVKLRVGAIPPEAVLKEFRSIGVADPIQVKKINREIAVWQRLNHENVVPFLGITTRYAPLRSLISIYMPNGTVTEYLKEHKTANRLIILWEIARGLRYLHQQEPPICHGDLKAANVLIDSDGTARLSDFGLSRTEEQGSLWDTGSHSRIPGSTRWMAPELFHPEQKTVHIPSDIYAYAMTSYEIMTGEVPFATYSEYAVISEVLADRRPRQREGIGITRRLWNCWRRCWQKDARNRPEMHKVVFMVGYVCGGTPDGRKKMRNVENASGDSGRE